MRSIEERDRVRSRLGAVTGGREPEVVAELDDAERTPEWLDLEPEQRRQSSWLPDRLRAARFDPGRPGAVTLGLVGIAVVVIAGVAFLLQRPQSNAVPALPAVSPSSTAARMASATPSVLFVCVHNAGRSQMAAGFLTALAEDRIEVRSAGTAPAEHVNPAAVEAMKEVGIDITTATPKVLTVNMAQRLIDGDQVLVGVASTDGGPPVLGSGTVSSGTATTPGPTNRGKVNLNSATEAELDALPGVGPVTAAAIVAWRSVNGRFTDVEQLGEVEGIGPARLAKLRELVTI